MEKEINNKYIFLYGLNFVRISPRDEKNIQELLDKYGDLQKVPGNEIACACYTKVVKGKYIDDENYFYLSVNELAPSTNELKRRSIFRKLFSSKGAKT